MKKVTIKLPEHLVDWLDNQLEGKEQFILKLVRNAYDEDYYSKWGNQEDECYTGTCYMCGDSDC